MIPDLERTLNHYGLYQSNIPQFFDVKPYSKLSVLNISNCTGCCIDFKEVQAYKKLAEEKIRTQKEAVTQERPKGLMLTAYPWNRSIRQSGVAGG